MTGKFEVSGLVEMFGGELVELRFWGLKGLSEF